MPTTRSYLASLAFVFSCVGTTGGEIVDFPAAAAGGADATSPLAFDETTTSGHVWHVVLTTATIHVGAVYLDQALPVSGAGTTSCILPGTYTAEVLDGLDVDLLSPLPQSFASLGHGTTTSSLAAQVWLTGGDVNAATDDTKILVVSGTAHDDDGTQIPFDGTITISTNRDTTDTTTGASPPCKQRIVSPIPTTVSVATTGGLLVRIDAKALFANVDFSKLAPSASGFSFSDDPSSADYTQPSVNLWSNLHSAGTYTFAWGSF
jgi:hypothetical protein